MKTYGLLLASLLATVSSTHFAWSGQGETLAQHNTRMQWWREARFGLFIHWGLYAIPAGTWGDKTDYGEWIRNSAEIPLEQYDKFVQRFQPAHFDPARWVQAAKAAGMKYIVITTKHHDGFCLFDSKQTDFDVMSTPFRRDIMKALAEECRRQGMKICWYYSIMDWHHPDYLPRRDWEKTRSTEGADYARYVHYMKEQLRELLTNYGEIGVLWFDGEWENTWNRKLGRELYDYVRNLQPSIIINNRVGAGRSGMEGFSEGESSAGDFGTPEQQIPARGLPGIDWETCMTMNDHWGYNSHDNNWKTPNELLHMLADIASKGGNFLLNIGPTADGEFPPASLDRLHAIGNWMQVNREAIYGTKAGPFSSLPWGRCTQKPVDRGTRLYLHVFEWPNSGRLEVPGLLNDTRAAYLLSDSRRRPLSITRNEDAVEIAVPSVCPDTINSVVVLEITGQPDVVDPPSITSDFPILVDSALVKIASSREDVDLRYTLDGAAPTATSLKATVPFRITSTVTVSARCFRDGRAVSGIAHAVFKKVNARAAMTGLHPQPGLIFRYFEGSWDELPDYTKMEPLTTGTVRAFDISLRRRPEQYGIEFAGYIRVPETGVYRLFTDSDDGSRLYIGESLVVDNDRLHGMQEASGVIALSAGYHPLRVMYFQKSGGEGLKVSWMEKEGAKAEIPAEALFH